MGMYKNGMGTQGFTLVELSIVIIIIGFLIAGIAAGTSLIKQAELNSIVTDFQGYQTSYNNFLGRYTKAPGDFDAGGTIWPSTAAAPCSATDANCNGNANGVIDLGGQGTPTNEGVIAWKQLSLANMISSGIQDPAQTSTDGVLKLGTSVPLSKVGGAGYMMFMGSDNGATNPGITTLTGTGLWNDNKTNAVYIGKPAGAALFLDTGALKAEDAFNIDKKLDDGAVSGGVFTGANTGFIRTVEGVNATAADCLVGGNAATASTYAIGTGTASSACVVALGLN